MDVFEKYNLNRVINASGKMTILGVSKVSDGVVLDQKIGGQSFFEMSDLIEKTGAYIAEKLGTENATIVSSASAGIAQSIAALIGEGDHYHLMHPYSDKFTKREIILPKGHNVNYGTSVELMIQQGGGVVVEAGYANECHPEQVEMLINEKTAALFYVKSHHTVQKSMLSIEEMVSIAKKHQLPLVLDAAAEEDLVKYYQQGVDLAIYSGGKAIEGPSSGLVIGKDPYIGWIQLQSKGLGRSMKIGKENILGLTRAIEEYLTYGSESGQSMIERLEPFIEQLNAIDDVVATIVQDGAGRDIYRAKVDLNNLEFSAFDMIAALKKGSPSVYTREYQANNGIIEFDIRSVNKDEMDEIVKKFNHIIEENK
ncbi:DgaE family pyridoxal phosphate-dependent ammonia lyase [Vagococcus xieshaowenii]|uniref:DgaE family pyridoxal phosphate-dependent ammonia lyase n=1 Tax=Vagococcus xieshaowenii TaxID=2562451 RepID=A0A4Z0D4K8_9ENTE|nr:DgaE family pyridoxal phosphate-dependent ammonia lyase [Vagococcus xieshaowenii]QCA29393.1 DgaE family pyridoxal phosphate-dependent ammonia lyase [Vagococcus xieshaowenii]TFZ39314.1 DgaE family pyridoxal phosphate-dependent ammonia lyase [Vagococcus xieshaowenii]